MTKQIDSRLPIDTSVPPVEIKPEDSVFVDELREKAEELDDFRKELGRLCQVTNNLRIKADEVETALNTKRKELLSKYDIVEGSWVIDFQSKTIVKLGQVVPPPA
jgi:uncharacterized membrane protein